jgi:hypothetical protein
VEEIWIPGGDEVFKGNWYFVTGAPLRLATSGLDRNRLFVDVHRKVEFMTPKIGFKVLVRLELLSKWAFS